MRELETQTVQQMITVIAELLPEGREIRRKALDGVDWFALRWLAESHRLNDDLSDEEYRTQLDLAYLAGIRDLVASPDPDAETVLVVSHLLTVDRDPPSVIDQLERYDKFEAALRAAGIPTEVIAHRDGAFLTITTEQAGRVANLAAQYFGDSYKGILERPAVLIRVDGLYDLKGSTHTVEVRDCRECDEEFPLYSWLESRTHCFEHRDLEGKCEVCKSEMIDTLEGRVCKLELNGFVVDDDGNVTYRDAINQAGPDKGASHAAWAYARTHADELRRKR